MLSPKANYPQDLTNTQSLSFLDSPSIDWKTIVTSLLIGKYAFETYINYRQFQVYQRKEPPASIKEEVTQETFTKSQEYSRAKSKFSFFSDALELLKDVASIKYDLLPKLWGVAGCLSSKLSHVGVIGRFFGTSVMSQSVVFFAISTILSTLESLPLSYYLTFVLEEKYGFNKSTFKIWITDAIKLLVLSVVLGSPFVYGFLKIIERYGPAFVSYACVLVLGAQLLFMTIIPSLILPLFYKFTPLEDGELKTEIEALAAKNGFPLSQLFVIDGSTRSAHSNAFFVGLPWSKKIVLFDTLIEHNTTEQTVAVLAHEIGHWKLNHLPQMLLTSQITVGITFALFSAFLENKSLFQSFGFNTYPAIISFMLFSYVNTPVNCLTQFATNLLSRKNEYQADEYAKGQGYTEDLAASLIKLSTKNLSSLNTDWLFSAYNHSHPILADRLSALGYVSKEKLGDVKVDIEKSNQ
ncbi:CIC11C00000004187 [Sungouiella intermedia]|uniref:CAAX prenyl protease n=1 Tax=Sungouiella intermedia TaxID=45354 RepID=A0A1L0C5J9_9ASCO|nr:CIC11C00000004187 [[Candida] intermedia]